ncbi:hypothetical protein ACFSJ3_14285 [Corallincola platygyrae]|uniref:PsbP C-terminal domain-containing protein n=1 Tax=Corallincola platygyrae TaxID=1193278 RepID=A0ABW4XQ08_9GAMM
MNKSPLLPIGFLLSVVLFSASLLTGCGEHPLSSENKYQKDGFSMLLPNGWEVSQDYFPTSTHRLITLSTSVSSRARIEVFDTSASRPNLEMYLQQYMADAIPEAQRASVKISHGEVERNQGRGYFVEVNQNGETDTNYYIEVIEMQYVDHQSYVTLHTPNDSKARILAEFNQLIDSINNEK